MRSFLLTAAIIAWASTAQAEFLVSSSIIEFTPESGQQQDIELVSRSEETQYIESTVFEIANPGEAGEVRQPVADPADAGILVTPDKAVLPAGGRKVLRFVQMQEADDRDHIYRVEIKPVVRGLQNEDQVGIKLMVGYDALVIVRPGEIRSSYDLQRQGRKLTLRNDGNSNVLLQSGRQCPPGVEPTAERPCPLLPALRVYAGQTGSVDLPSDGPVTYLVWDGLKEVEKTL